MTATPDPKTVREIARDCVADYINDARDIAAHVMGHFGMGVPGNVYTWTDAVRTDLRAVVPSWPDEQPQDERDARIAELEREVRQLRAGAPRAWKQDWRNPISRFETFVNATRNYDSDHLGGIMRGGNAEATITLGDLRAVLARLAELEAHPWIVVEAEQPQDDGDVRAAAAMSDHLKRVTAYLRAVESYGDDEEGNVIASECNRDGGPDDPGYLPLTRDDLRALVADAKQLRELRPEYGIRITDTSTRTVEGAVGETLGDALAAVDQLDTHRSDVLRRTIIQRPVGDWHEIGDGRG